MGASGEWRDAIIPGIGTRRVWVPSEDPGGEAEYLPLSTVARMLNKSFRGVEVLINQGVLRADVPDGTTRRKVYAESVRNYIERMGPQVESAEDRAIDEWRRTGRASQATLRSIERRNAAHAAEMASMGVYPSERQPERPADNGVDPLAAYQARYAPEKR